MAATKNSKSPVSGQTRPVPHAGGLGRVFFLSDLHCPFHDKQALKIVYQVLADFKPDILVSNGDFVDFFAISRHSKDPLRATKLRGELATCNSVLDRLDSLSGGARRIYMGGNHEDRLDRYIADKAPELAGLQTYAGGALDVPGLLGLRERGWEYVPYKDDIRLGKVWITHDVGTAGRYNVFKSLDTYQASIVTGHTHRLAYVVEGDAAGGRKVSAQFGWLGDVSTVNWMHRVKARREWCPGFGYGYLNPSTGYVYLVPVPIVKGTAMVEGRLYAP